MIENKYTALTIGPIIKTLQSVKSTKAIWAASFLFSYIMKEVIKQLKGHEKDIIIPYVAFDEKNEVNTSPELSTSGAGLFPDRLMIKGKYDLKPMIENVICDLAIKITEDLNDKDKQPSHQPEGRKSAEGVSSFLREYLTFYPIQLELEEGANVIQELSHYLDTQELNQPLMTDSTRDFLHEFLEEVYYNFLIEKGFGNSHLRFPSTVEIANAGFSDQPDYNTIRNELLKRTDDEDAQQRFLSRLKEDKDLAPYIRNHQKYIAIVQADGDNMGKLIAKFYDEHADGSKIQVFSEQMTKFSVVAVKLIKAYKGTPVYAGGDDLLFFAPVATTSISADQITFSTILDLIDRLDASFQEHFIEDDRLTEIVTQLQLEDKPSLSLGMSIGYYKYPLNESLAKSLDLLLGEAKAGKKNNISWKVLKHSGQTFGSTWGKSTEEYKLFKQLTKSILQMQKTEKQVESGTFLHGVVYKMDMLRPLVLAIANQEQSVFDERLSHFFMNQFDESVHLDGQGLIPFLKDLLKLMQVIYKTHPIDHKEEEEERKKQNDENMDRIYSALRFIDFITNNVDRDEY